MSKGIKQWKIRMRKNEWKKRQTKGMLIEKEGDKDCEEGLKVLIRKAGKKEKRKTETKKDT